MTVFVVLREVQPNPFRIMTRETKVSGLVDIVQDNDLLRGTVWNIRAKGRTEPFPHHYSDDELMPLSQNAKSIHTFSRMILLNTVLQIAKSIRTND